MVRPFIYVTVCLKLGATYYVSSVWYNLLITNPGTGRQRCEKDCLFDQILSLCRKLLYIFSASFRCIYETEIVCSADEG